MVLSRIFFETRRWLVRRLIKQGIVYEDKFTVEFKSGATVNVNE